MPDLTPASLSATKVLPPTPPNGVDPLGETAPTTPEAERRTPTGRLSPLGPGSKIGVFKIVSHLGRGGMGDVYRAHDEELDRDVALKTIAPLLLTDLEFVERFRSEAKAAAKIVHPHVVQVYSWGEDAGTSFFAMELVPGQSLGERLRHKGPVPWPEALRIGLEIAGALEAAQVHGVIHRDVKPENILLSTSGAAKVADFGLAKRVADPGTTASGVIVGTPRYMSPEQAQGDAIDARSDMYSLGATLFHVMTGRPVFDGSSPMKVCLKHIQEPPPELSSVIPDLPEPVTRVVSRLLKKNRDERPASYAELKVEIEAALALAPDAPRGTPTPNPGFVVPVPVPALKAPIIQIVKRPDGGMELGVNLCPVTGGATSVPNAAKRARQAAPLAPVWRRALADLVDLGHLGLVFGLFSLLPLPFAPFSTTVLAILITNGFIQYHTRHGGSVGERLMDVRLVSRTGGMPSFSMVGMGFMMSKGVPWILGVVITYCSLAKDLGVGRVIEACLVLAGGAALEIGFGLATGLSFRDRVFKSRVIDVRGLPVIDDEPAD